MHTRKLDWDVKETKDYALGLYTYIWYDFNKICIYLIHFLDK